MSTRARPDAVRRLRRVRPWLPALLLVVGGLGAGADSRAAPVRVTPHTEVRSIRFTGARDLSDPVLKRVVTTRSRGRAFGLRNLLGKLPFIDPPERHPFSPRVLQEDVVRLRDRFAASGFPGTEVEYRVERVGDEDLLDITFVIHQGDPLRVIGLDLVPADSLGPLPVPQGQARSWEGMTRRVRSLAGRRFNLTDALQDRDLVRSWWRDRGFPEAVVTLGVDRDTLADAARLRFVIDPGPRTRFGTISIDGNTTVSDRTVLRELPFRPGDPYSERAILQARGNLQQLPIVRNARVKVQGPPAAADSELAVAVTVTEARPRVVTGELGYGLDTGGTLESSWSHRNFTGGARVFTVSGLAQTGRFAVIGDPDTRYRGAVSLQQPHFLKSRLSAVVSPFLEYRSDTRDRSLQVGSNFTLVYELDRQLSVSLDYQIASRRIYEYRFGDLGAGDIDIVTFLTHLAEGQVDSLGTTLGTSLVTLSGLVGNLDSPTNPRRGLLARPSLQVTAPTGWSRISYWKADGSAYAFAPLSRRAVLAARITAGRLFPFGKSLPGSGENPSLKALQLRDATFTAGGSSDVRGWGDRSLGPKFPDIRFREQGDSLVAVADGYVPLGGFSRVSFSLELRLPLPGAGPNLGCHVFLDGGRVWTDDTRFGEASDAFDQERFFYAAGAGLDFLTPVGAIKLSLGYKLNPSVVDLVNAEDLLGAIIQGDPVGDLERHQLRRFQLSLAFGASY